MYNIKVISVRKNLIQGYSSVGRAAVSKTACRGFKSFCPCQIENGYRKVTVFVLALSKMIQTPRHAERVEGCGSPVETSARSAEAPTEPAGETKSFCPCQNKKTPAGVFFVLLLKQKDLNHEIQKCLHF